MTRARTLAAGAAAAVLTLTMSACSDEAGSPDDPTSGSSGSSGSSKSSTTQPAPELKDRSSEIFDGAKEPTVLGKTTGSVVLGLDGIAEEKVLFEVTEVTATADSTLLRYQLTSQQDTSNQWVEGRFWYDQPTLQAPGSDTTLQSVTGAVQVDGKTEERCVCTAVRFMGSDPRSQTTLYPPLPKDATEVEVTLDGLDPVTVPVTR